MILRAKETVNRVEVDVVELIRKNYWSIKRTFSFNVTIVSERITDDFCPVGANLGLLEERTAPNRLPVTTAFHSKHEM